MQDTDHFLCFIQFNKFYCFFIKPYFYGNLLIVNNGAVLNSIAPSFGICVYMGP